MRRFDSAHRAFRQLSITLPAVATVLLGSQGHSSAADTTASWLAISSSTWTSPSKWSTGSNYPENNRPAGVDYQAVLNVTGSKGYTVSLITPITIDGLTIDSNQATLNQSSQTFTPGTVNIIAGTYVIDGGSAIVDDAATDVGVAGKLELMMGTMSGGSALADGSGSFIAITSGFTESAGATIQAINGGEVELQGGGFVNNANLPTTSANGILSLGSGAILDNTGTTAGSSNTLQPPAGAILQLNGGTISAGTVNSTGGTFLNASSGTLDGTPTGGITLVGTLQHNAGAITYLQGLINDTSGFTFEASASNVNSSSYNIVLKADTELSGAGTTTTLATGNFYGQTMAFGGMTDNEQLMIDSDHTLLSQTIVTSSGAISLINNGTIQADGSGNSFDLALSTGGSSNSGTIEATNGASFTLNNSAGGTLNNGGEILADGSGSFLAIQGGGVSNTGLGSIQATNGGTVELQNGNFINSGLMTAGTNGAFSIGNNATLDNTGTTPGSVNTLQAASGGTLQLNGGTISGGTINSTGGTFLNVSSGTLDGTPSGGITLIGTLLHDYSATTYLQGLINDPSGFTFDSAPSGGFYPILLSGDTELSGNGTTTTLANSAGGSTFFGGNNNSRLTIDNGHTLLSAADVYNYYFYPIALTNNGTLQADGANNLFYMALTNGSSSNAGVIEATNGASVTLDNSNGGTFTNSGTMLADGTGSLLTINGNGFTNTGMGSIQVNDGGAVELQNGNFTNDDLVIAGANSTFSIGNGASLDNTGTNAGSSSTLQAPSGGTLQLNGGTISGGTVNSTGGTFFSQNGATLDGTPSGGITLIGTLTVGAFSQTYLQGLINDPYSFTFDLPAPAGYEPLFYLMLSGDTELKGDGSTTTLANNNNSYEGVYLGTNNDSGLTIDSGHTLLVDTAGYSYLRLTNNGTIQADGANNGLYCELGAGSINSGAIKATNGASVTLDTTSGGTLTNSGSLLADGPGSFLAISGNGISNSGRGTIQATNGGTVELQYGGFINNGFVTAGPGSTFSIGILATFDNTGVTPGSSSTLQSPAGGTLQLNGGMISGGTVSGAGGTFLNATPPGGYGSTLDGTPTGGITLIGTLMHNNGASTFLQGLINDPDGFMFDSAPAAGAGAYYNLLLASDTELSGAGTTTTLANSNGGTINFGGPTANNGSMITCSQLTIDDGHRLLVQADVPNSNLGVVVTLTNNGTVQADGPNNQFYLALANASSNAGTIAATNGALVTLDNSAGGTFDNSGTLEATNGGIITLVSAGLTNTGLIVLHDGTINTDIPLAIGDGTLCGSGTINGDVMLDSDPSTLAFEIRSGMDFDSLTINGNIYLAGDLEITLAPGAIVIENDSFDILTADSLSGSFLDVADGQRLQTTDGGGSFLVNYGTGADADEIVLSDFQSIPEPASASLLLMGAGGLLVRRRLFSKG